MQSSEKFPKSSIAKRTIEAIDEKIRKMKFEKVLFTTWW